MMFKKYLFIFLIISTIRLPEVFAQLAYNDVTDYSKTTIFKDSFDDNNNNWITDNSWIRGYVVSGNYRIICKNYKKSTGLSFKTIPVDQDYDYELETSLKVVKGTGAFVFGMNRNYDHYRIEIYEDNLEIIKDFASQKKTEKLFSGSVSPDFVKGAFNKITIRKIKSIFYVYFNESLVGKFDKIKPEGDQLGFSASVNSEITVDNVSASYINSAGFSNLADKNRSAENSITRLASGPEITWISPSGTTTTLDTYTARIRASIKSDNGLKGAQVYVNGISRGDAELRPVPDVPGKFQMEKVINLNPGDNSIYILATNEVGASRSELRFFSNPSATPPVVSWQNPADPNTMVNRGSFTIEVCIKSLTELRSVKLLVNGSTQAEDNVLKTAGTGDCSFVWQVPVVLKEGDNELFVISANEAGTTTSELRLVKLQTSNIERRLALVFGNADYGNKVSLKNPVNDANLMEGSLRALGFDVIKRINSKKTDMEEAIREFSQKLPDYNVALFYYAGHGNQVDGTNYLIPTDAVLKEKEACKFEAIQVDFIVEEFEKYPENTNIVILDACRDNPFTNWARGGEKGFKALSFTNGTIISFATSEGTTAADGTGANGLFTEELVRQMFVPQKVEDVFKRTRVEVSKRSNGKQVPQEWTKLTGDFYFKK